MKTKKRSRGYGTILLFALAATLLIFSTVGSSRAALSYTSEIYGAQVSMQDIGITLVENGEAVSWRDYQDADTGKWDEKTGALLENMLKPLDADGNPVTTEEDETLKTGYAYPEKLAVVNSGTIDTYVRVTVYHYWKDKETGKRRNDLDPGLIDLHLTPGDDWIVDKAASTKERTVLYYKHILPGKTGTGGDESYSGTEPFSDTLTIKGFDGVEVEVKHTYDNAGKLVETTFTYDGQVFVLEVDADAVQTHNAEDAIKSAWGVTVRRNGDDITDVQSGE